MALKQAGAFFALMALCTPAAAFDAAQTIFYVSIPLDRQSAPVSFGLRLQDGGEHRAIDIDSGMLRFVSAGGIEAHWILAGALALGAAAAVKGDRRAEQQAASAPQQSAPSRPPQPCPQTCN
jgi:hypothetical protein